MINAMIISVQIIWYSLKIKLTQYLLNIFQLFFFIKHGLTFDHEYFD